MKRITLLMLTIFMMMTLPTSEQLGKLVDKVKGTGKTAGKK